MNSYILRYIISLTTPLPFHPTCPPLLPLRNRPPPFLWSWGKIFTNFKLKLKKRKNGVHNKQ